MCADVVFCWFRHASCAFSDIGSDSTRTTHIITFIFISTVHLFLACFVLLSVLPPPSSLRCFSSSIPTSNSMVVFQVLLVLTQHLLLGRNSFEVRMSPYKEWKSAFAGQASSVAHHIDAQDMDILLDGAGPWKAWLEIHGPTETCQIMSHPFIYSRRSWHWQCVAWVVMETADSVPSGMRNDLRLPEMRWLKAHEAFTMNNLIFAESHRWETLKCITLLATQLATSSTCIAGYLLFSLGTDVTLIHFYSDFVSAR